MRIAHVVCLLSLLVLFPACDSPGSGSTRSDVSADPVPTEDALSVVGYLPDYRVREFEPRRAHGIDQLIYFSIEVEPDGALNTRRLREGALEKIADIQLVTECDALICVGGWDRSEGFSEMSANRATRDRFANELISFCQQHGFSGVDLDWEHPTTPEERHQLTVLLQELREHLHAEELLLTVACAPWQPLNDQAAGAVDRIHLMSYDDEGRHSTLEQATDNLDKWIDAGIPAEKIVLGVPFYGRRFSASDRSSATYGEIVARFTPDADADEVDGYYFNGPETMQAKVELAMEHGLGGIMVWELAQDSQDEEASLLRVIRRTLDSQE
jgi:GH18 family chitinase